MSTENILALLRITYPDNTEQVVVVRQTPLDIGRIPPNHVVLPDPEISRSHARLLFEFDRIHLVDLNSRNGTFISGERLAPNAPRVVAYGELFRIGPYQLRLEPTPLPEPIAVNSGATAPQSVPEPRLGATELPVAIIPPTQLPELVPPPYEQIFGLNADACRYLDYLPPIYHEHPLLARFLSGFESVLAPIEQTVDNFDLFLDPIVTPASFLDQLAGWLGLTLDEKWPLSKRRVLVEQAANLYCRRGTRWALCRHMEIYSGLTPEILEARDRPHFFQVRLRVPAGQTLDRATVERIIAANQPAHTTYALEITSED